MVKPIPVSHRTHFRVVATHGVHPLGIISDTMTSKPSLHANSAPVDMPADMDDTKELGATAEDQVDMFRMGKVQELRVSWNPRA